MTLGMNEAVYFPNQGRYEVVYGEVVYESGPEANLIVKIDQQQAPALFAHAVEFMQHNSVGDNQSTFIHAHAKGLRRGTFTDASNGHWLIPSESSG